MVAWMVSANTCDGDVKIGVSVCLSLSLSLCVCRPIWVPSLSLCKWVYVGVYVDLYLVLASAHA